MLPNGGRFEDPPRHEGRPSREYQHGLHRGAVGPDARSDRRAVLFRIAMARWSVSRGSRPMMRAIARGIGRVRARAAALHQWTHRERGGPHLRTEQQQRCQPAYDRTCHARMRSAPTIVTTWRAVNRQLLRAAQLAPVEAFLFTHVSIARGATAATLPLPIQLTGHFSAESTPGGRRASIGGRPRRRRCETQVQ